MMLANLYVIKVKSVSDNIDSAHTMKVLSIHNITEILINKLDTLNKRVN